MMLLTSFLITTLYIIPTYIEYIAANTEDKSGDNGIGF